MPIAKAMAAPSAAGRMMLNISTPMGEKEVEALGKALKSSLMEMKPYIEKASPELIV